MNMTTEFWLVWRPNGGNPMKQHLTEASARAEAERLAKQNAGAAFYVLKALARCKATAPVEWKSMETCAGHVSGCVCQQCMPF